MIPGYRIECIPNISSADPNLLARISEAIQQIPEVRLHFVDPGHAANRTVFTYLGPAHRVFEATHKLFDLALAHIDMRTHTGVHPRMGAVDVCPFVLLDDPVHEADLIAQTKAFAHAVSTKHRLAIWGYEKLATSPEHINLANVRKGQYEGLSKRMEHGTLPDFGPQSMGSTMAEFGATALAVRDLMVAYNVNLKGGDKATLLPIAKQIAAKIRERDGGMPGVKSIGWYLPDFDLVQVSCNLTQPHLAGVCEVFDRVQELAAEAGCTAPSSELIGCIPQSQFTTYSANELGFGSLKPFNDDRILPI